jgi:hypothetical protein
MSDFDPAEREAKLIVLMNGAVEAAVELLDTATGGDESVVVGALWCRVVIQELARQFSPHGESDQLAREVNAALAARGAPYRLTKGVA